MDVLVHHQARDGKSQSGVGSVRPSYGPPHRLELRLLVLGWTAGTSPANGQPSRHLRLLGCVQLDRMRNPEEAGDEDVEK